VGKEAISDDAIHVYLLRSPVAIDRYADKFNVLLLLQPFQILFILELIEGACAVDQQTSFAQRIPGVGENASLTSRAPLNSLRRPLVDRSLVLAKEALARAWCVDNHNIEKSRQSLEISRIIVGYNAIRITPFLDILCQYGGS